MRLRAEDILSLIAIVILITFIIQVGWIMGS